MFTLRDYQKDAVEAVMKDMKTDGHSLVILPTGAGKSLVIAEIANRLNQNILILAPSKEIVEQNSNKMRQYVSHHEIGIYSASMNSKNIRKYTFATIQSIYRKPDIFKRFEIVLLDECDLMNVKNSDGMFTQFFEAIAAKKVFGFTATPYRNMQAYHKNEQTKQFESAYTLKLINRIKPDFWKRIIYNINNQVLFSQGYLCPLKYYDRSAFDHSQIPMNKSHTDFDTERFALKLATQGPSIFDLIRRAADKRKSVLVFCNSVAEAKDYARCFLNSAAVDGKTPKDERDRIIRDFRFGKIKVVFNMNCLTVGFDHPELDTIFMLRPTRSLRLYYQMLGRGIRIAEGKTECVVVDFTSNVKNLGRIETIRLHKEKRLLDKYPMWYLESEAGDWHNRVLYSMEIKSNPSQAELIAQEMERQI